MKRLVTALTLTIVAMLVALPVLAVDFSQNEDALAWFRQAQEPDGGFSNGFSEGSDFGTTAEVVLAAVAAGVDVSTWVTAEDSSPLDALTEQVATVSDLGNLSKAALVAVATGQDPRGFGGRDLVAAIQASQDESTGMFGGDLFKHAYAVLALQAAEAIVSPDAVTAMTSQITEDGGWALFGGTTPGTADTNTTALVMQALVAVGEADAAAAALPYLRRMQNADGGFPYQKPSEWGTETDANSTAVVLQALNALGEPLGEWTSEGTDPLGALMALWDSKSGAYFWQASVAQPNVLATAQAVQASEGMTLATLTPVGAQRAHEVVGEAEVSPLLPSSGLDVASGTGVLMVVILALVALSAVLRRK